MPEELPLLSVIIPCRNEASHIASCLASVLASDYPRDRMEVLVVDGLSTDGSRDTVTACAAANPCIRLLDNPDRTTPLAINLGIRASAGEAVIILGAHTEIDTLFLRNSVENLLQSGADCVGGPITTVPGSSSPVALAIADVLTSRFGIGNSHFRTGCREPRLVDTVPYGCYRRDVFARIGLFSDSLIRNQDIEFNLRLRRSGGRILLVPAIRSFYHAKRSFREFFIQNFMNGFWVFYSLRFAAAPFSLRHLIPCVFVLSLLAGLGAALVNPQASILLFLVLGAYTAADLAASALSVRGRHAVLLPLVFLAFALLHVSYGLGSVWGIIRLLLSGGLRPNAAPAS